MSIELRVSTGARAGHRATFDGAAIGIGRHPLSDLQFDAERDLDVSARHAEIVVEDGHHMIRDVGSTNGTFVNGSRVVAPRELRDGDVIMLGPDGPRIIVGLTRDAGLSKSVVAADGRAAVLGSAPSSASARTRLAISLGIAAVMALAGAYWLGARDSRAQAASLGTLARRTDSLRAARDREVGVLSARVAGLDSALALAQMESESLRARLRANPSVENTPGSRALQQAELRHEGIVSASAVDYSGIAALNGAAVVLIAVEMSDGRSFTGSGFGVREDGVVVTNRHLLESPDGASVRRIAVIYSDTRVWLPARVIRQAATDDLALLLVERGGPFPVVGGLEQSVPSPAVGAPVAIIGYPLGTDTPMGGTPSRMIARATLGAGMVSKVVDGVMQIDAFAGEGSSGSPVFDRSGAIVGVVYGGARPSGGRIVYAIPGERVAALLADVGRETVADRPAR